MRRKLLFKIFMITTTALLIGLIVSFTMFNYMNINSVESTLQTTAKSVTERISSCTTKEEMIDVITDDNSEVVYFTVYDHNNDLIYDKHENILKNKGTNNNKYMIKAREKSYSIKIGIPYTNDATMLMYSFTINNSYIDPEGDMIIRASMVVMYNNEPFWTSIIIALLIWIAILGASYIIVNEAVRVAVAPIADVEKSMKDISNGCFHKSSIINSGDKELDGLYNQLGIISDQISVSFEELKQEKEKLKFLLASISQGIIVLSKMGTIMLYNRAAGLLFDNEDLSGTSVEYVFEGELLENVQKALDNKTSEVVLLHKNGSTYRSECMPVDKEFLSATMAENLSLLVIFTDITQEEETNKIRSEFFANASHELKTPLTAISGYSEIMSMGNRDEKVKEKCVNEISVNASKMKKLIDDMMKLSKLDAKLDIEEESNFDLLEVCQKVFDEQIMVAKNKKVTLKIEGDSQYILGRKNMIKIVVENLVSNAIKYNKEQGSVTISLSRDAKDQAVLSVKDTGIGIPSEHKDRLFERFYKVDAARTRTEESSTGLGLSIVKNIINIHKAHISIDSKLGEGTTVTVVFPKNNIEEA